MTAIGVAGVAVAGAAMLGTAPTMSVSPQLLASLHYLRGTTNGHQATQQEYEDFISAVVTGTNAPTTDGAYEKVDYTAGFWPISAGGFKDLKYDDSVAEGVANLEKATPGAGDVIFGFSQGAAVASQYKATHQGNTYILVANPNRPNGGILERFAGLHVPILDVTFNGATPATSDPTIDVARQYDGWADFPTYVWNPLAIANALAGMALVHGNTQFVLTADDLKEARESGDSDYYQVDGKTNTTYYVVRTYPIPLLMPLDPFLPDQVIAALDAPLRKIIETAYDRTDYGAPTRATLFPRRTPRPEVATVDEPQVVEQEQQQRSTPAPQEPDEDRNQSGAPERTPWKPGKHLREAVEAANATRQQKKAAQHEAAENLSRDGVEGDSPKKVTAPKNDAPKNDAPKKAGSPAANRGAA